MRFQLITCKVLRREAYYCAARSCNEVDVVLIRQGLHDTPELLKEEIQKALAVTEDLQGRGYDASLLGYGLCSNSIVGLTAKIPVAAARGHDCVTLLLGSKEKYKEYFDAHRGVYWYSSGWIETTSMPGRERYDNLLAEYKEKYGVDNAEYLMETEQGWLKEYSRAVYIDWGFPNAREEKEYTKKCARFLGWEYDEVKGDSGLLQRMTDGQWSEDEFLVIEPGHKISEDVSNCGIIKTE